MNQPQLEKKDDRYRMMDMRMNHIQMLFDGDFSGDWFTEMQTRLPYTYSRIQFKHDLKEVWRRADLKAKAALAKAEHVWMMIRKEEKS